MVFPQTALGTCFMTAVVNSEVQNYSPDFSIRDPLGSKRVKRIDVNKNLVKYVRIIIAYYLVQTNFITDYILYIFTKTNMKGIIF